MRARGEGRRAEAARGVDLSDARAPASQARRVRIALLVFGVALTVFAAIALDVMTGGGLTRLDQRVAAALPAQAAPALLEFMRGVSALHVTRIVMGCTALLAFVLWWARRRDALLTLLLAVPPGAALNHALKHAFRRPRPELHDALASMLGDFSFPSGHTVQATLLYGALCIVLVPRVPGRRWRIGLVAAAVAMVALVGTSRVVLGAHYPSDVLGGVAEGVAWLALCVAAVGARRWRGRAAA